MDVTWYLVLSAFIFAIGAAGVISRRNPLVVLLCLELMLNAGNLALVAFSRMHGGAAILLSFIASIGALLDLQDHPHDDRQLVDSIWTYASTADFRVDLSILIDPLSVFMCLVVSGV